MTKQLPAVNVGVDIGKSQLDLYLLERDRAPLSGSFCARYRLGTSGAMKESSSCTTHRAIYFQPLVCYASGTHRDKLGPMGYS